MPSHFPTAEAGVLYSPRNYDGRYRGPLLARRALAGSENVPAVVLASELGVPTLLRFLTRAGLSTFDRTPSYYGLGLTLGNAEVRLDQLVAAYATFARGGEWLEPTWSLRLQGGASARRGPPVAGCSSRRAPRSGSPTSCPTPSAREYIFGRGGSLEFPFPVAVEDRHVAGVSRQLDHRLHARRHRRRLGRQLRSHAAQGLDRRHRRGADLPRRDARRHQTLHGAAGFDARAIVAAPDGLVEREVCALSGMPANPWCPARQRERLPPPTSRPCSWHHQSDEGLLVVWPPAYRQWARENGLLSERQHTRHHRRNPWSG